MSAFARKRVPEPSATVRHRLRLSALVVLAWLLVALAWTVPTFWVEQVEHAPGTLAPGVAHVLVQMVAMYTPWAFMTPFIWRLGRNFPFATSPRSATAVHFASGIFLVPLMVLAGDLVARGVFGALDQPFVFTARGVFLTSFYCIPTFVALVAVGQGMQRREPASSGSVETGAIAPLAMPLLRLTVRERGRTDIVNVADIDFIDMAGHYLSLHVGPKVHLLRGTMREIEDRLDRDKFVRVHRSTIVQVDRITAISERKNGDCLLLLRGGAEVPASRSYRPRIAQCLGIHDDPVSNPVQDNDFPVRAKA